MQRPLADQLWELIEVSTERVVSETVPAIGIGVRQYQHPDPKQSTLRLEAPAADKLLPWRSAARTIRRDPPAHQAA